ncbi:unnamed protein product, partial [Ectocarpus sp. 12 AP-2014]
ASRRAHQGDRPHPRHRCVHPAHPREWYGLRGCWGRLLRRGGHGWCVREAGCQGVKLYDTGRGGRVGTTGEAEPQGLRALEDGQGGRAK